jgi:UDP-MurNAc hydroxylase
MDRIVWINHAGFELQTEGLRIVCDPWLDGLAFNQSWALLSKTKFRPDDFLGVDYLWFSHEHPDHFSPSDIRSVPPQIRASIKVLFQRTNDGRLAKFCRELGFKEVRELRDWERFELGYGVSITVKSVVDDSLCFIKTPHWTYLNINDCVAANSKAFHEGVAARVGPVDILLTQFSFANWAGNPDDPVPMRALASEKLEQIDVQLDAYHPKALIPFASFVWFCRPDNFHLNVGSNRIGAVHARFSKRIDCVVLYPGDVYEVGSKHDSAGALEKYDFDERLQSKPLEIEELPVQRNALDALSRDHLKKMHEQNGMWIFLPLRLSGFIRPVKIYLTDLDQALTYSMFKGILWTSTPREMADIEFASGALAQMLRYGTGYETLYISGRFTELRVGSRFDLSKNFVVLRRNEHGQFFPGIFLDGPYVKGRLGLN